MIILRSDCAGCGYPIHRTLFRRWRHVSSNARPCFPTFGQRPYARKWSTR